MLIWFEHIKNLKVLTKITQTSHEDKKQTQKTCLSISIRKKIGCGKYYLILDNKLDKQKVSQNCDIKGRQSKFVNQHFLRHAGIVVAGAENPC